jgi:hypothetical protein
MGRSKLPTDVKALARVHTESALKVLAGIMNAHDAPHSARVAAATTILARGWGQPHQSVDLTAEITTTKVIRTPTPASNLDAWQKQYADKPEPKELN